MLSTPYSPLLYLGVTLLMCLNVETRMLFMNCWYNGAFEVCVRWVYAKESAVNGSVYFILDSGVLWSFVKLCFVFSPFVLG